MTDELPTGWVEVTIGELFDTETGSTPPKNDEGNYGDFIPLVKPPELQGGAIHSAADGLSESGAAKARVLPSESVLVSCIGNLGKAALNLVPVAFNQQINAILPRKAIADPWFILYQVRSATFTRRLEALSSATTIAIVNKSKFNSLPVRIAPRQEQSRIVSKIDELFSRIDEGERALERVATLVERYRQSVLKAAVTGELTRDWREKNKDKLESGEALLARILKARREAWEKAELDKMKAKGITPANDKWKQKYEEPAAPTASDLPALPAGWAWLPLDAVADIVGGITVDQKRDADDLELVPYLRVANVQRGYLDLTQIKSIRAPRDRIEALALRSGDILFNEGGDLDKLGRGWIWESQLPLCIHQNHVFRARLFIEGGLNKIISWYCNVLGRTLFMTMGKQTTNLASLSLSKLKSLPIPVMSTVEAAEIVSRAEDVLSVVDKQLDELAKQAKGSAALQQSVLRSAFSGLLVSQDEADEPAASLLERISADRKAAPAASKRGRKPKTSERA